MNRNRNHMDIESTKLYIYSPIHSDICLAGISLSVCLIWLIYGIFYLFGV